MADHYPTTAVPFGGMLLPDLRDPVLAGAGAGGLGAAADYFLGLADTLELASGDLRAAMTKAQAGHEGPAADASRQYLSRIAAAGELGAAEARISYDALNDSAAYFSRVRDDMAAIPRVEEEQIHDPRAAAGRTKRIEEQRVLAVEASERYERNANAAYTRLFPLYEPVQIAPPGVAAAATAGGAGVGGAGAGGGGLGAGGAAPGAALGTEPALAGGGAGATGAGGAGGVGAAGAGGGPGAGGGGLGGAAGGGGAGGGAVGPGGVAPGGVGGAAGAGAGGAGARPPTSLRPASTNPDDRRYPTGWDTDGRGGSAMPRSPRPDTSGTASPGSTSSGWVPGQPWSSRTPSSSPGGGFAGRGVDESHGAGGRPSTGTGTGTGQAAAAAGRGPGGATGHHGAPLMPMGGGGRGEEGEHTRPSWLVEDDPQAFWFQGIPDHGPGVIGGDDRG